MIEIFNSSRTCSLGCYANFKVAKSTLNTLANNGQLGEKPSVLVCSYKNGEPLREYFATYNGKWRVPKSASQSVKSRKRKSQRPRELCKTYKSPEECFREGFPDWLNRSYPVPVLKQQGMNIKSRW